MASGVRAHEGRQQGGGMKVSHKDLVLRYVQGLIALTYSCPPNELFALSCRIHNALAEIPPMYGRFRWVPAIPVVSVGSRGEG